MKKGKRSQINHNILIIYLDFLVSGIYIESTKRIFHKKIYGIFLIEDDNT